LEHDPEKACPAFDAGWYRISDKIMLNNWPKRDSALLDVPTASQST
jgi:hypothetical protein